MSLKKLNTVYLGLAKECEEGEGGGSVILKGVWTATGQTDYSTIPLPATKGWGYLVNGTTTIDTVTYTSGDIIVFNKDVASGATILTTDLDLSNIDMVTKDNTITLTNKTINVDNNTLSNVEVDNFKTGVVQTTVRGVGSATDLALATEKAVSTSLASKQDTLPSASNTVEGKIRIATNGESTTGTSEVLAVNPLQLATKVDKEAGKGLSTNDYTTAEKNKLSGIETGAEVNDVVDVIIGGTTIVNGSKVAVIPNASNTVIGASRFATDVEAGAGTAEDIAVNPLQLKTGLDSAGGEIFDIVIESERTTKAGRAGLFSDAVNPLAKADIPLAYAKALNAFEAIPKVIDDDETKVTLKLSSAYRHLGTYDDKIYFIHTDLTTIKSASKVDLSDITTEKAIGETVIGFGIFDNINVVITSISNDNKLKIYSKTWVLLSNTSIGYIDSNYFKYPVVKVGENILVGRNEIFEIPDETEMVEGTETYTATIVTHTLGKWIHSICSFKGTVYIGFTNSVGVSDITHQYAPVDLNTDTIGTVIATRDNVTAGTFAPNICCNEDYIVIRERRLVTTLSHGYSTDGTNWTWVTKTSTNDIWFAPTDDNRFIVFGKYLGLTATSAPFSDWNKVDTAESVSTDNDKRINAVLIGDGIAMSSLTDEAYVYLETFRTASTDTKGDLTISYYLTAKGNKICMPDQNATLLSLWNLSGNVPYMVLDTTGETLQLPRWNVGYAYMIVDTSYVCPLINDVNQERFAKVSELPNSLVNRISVSANGDYATLKSAVDYFNASATANTEILLDAGVHLITGTVTVNNATYNLQIRGLGVSSTILNASTGLTGKPMFEIKTKCDIDRLSADGSTLTSYGTLTNENFISFTTNSDISYEITNCNISNFKIGIADLIGVGIFSFNFIIANCAIGTQINYSATPTNFNKLDLEIGNYESCPIGVDLLQGTKTCFNLSQILFVHSDSGDIGVKYTPATYIVANLKFRNIKDCAYNFIGTFVTGFDFTLPSGRDANIVIKSNVGEEDKTPHCEVSVADNATVTTCTDQNVYYKVARVNSKTNIKCDTASSGGSFTFTLDGLTTGAINYDATPATFATNIKNAIEALDGVTAVTVTTVVEATEWNVEFTTSGEGFLLPQSATNSLTGVTTITVTPSFYTCKFKIEENKITNLAAYPFDAEVSISGNVAVNANGQNLIIAVFKNGTELVAKMKIRTVTPDVYYNFSYTDYIDDFGFEDYLEIFVVNTTSAGKEVTVSDLTWYTTSR